MNETEMAARKRAAAARSRLNRDAREYAAELRAIVALAEPLVAPDDRWLVALAAYVRAALPDSAKPSEIGAALAAVSIALSEAAREQSAKLEAFHAEDEAAAKLAALAAEPPP